MVNNTQKAKKIDGFCLEFDGEFSRDFFGEEEGRNEEESRSKKVGFWE